MSPFIGVRLVSKLTLDRFAARFQAVLDGAACTIRIVRNDADSDAWKDCQDAWVIEAQNAAKLTGALEESDSCPYCEQQASCNLGSLCSIAHMGFLLHLLRGQICTARSLKSHLFLTHFYGRSKSDKTYSCSHCYQTPTLLQFGVVQSHCLNPRRSTQAILVHQSSKTCNRAQFPN